MTPSPLDAQALTAALAGTGWRRVDVVAETGSTNADLLARAAAGEDIAGTVLLAENQLAGRGRNGRAWSAVPGTQILMSIGVPTTGVPAAAWGWLPLATGLAVVDAVARCSTAVAAGLKWPNDVLVDGRKLAGILAEVAVGPADPVVVVGVGLNVSQRAEELPQEAAATSLAVLGTAPQRAELVTVLLEELDRRLAQWRAGPAAELPADYRAASVTVGSRVRALQPGDTEVLGDAVAVDDQGRLVIDTDAGPVAVSAGDIVHLRPL